MSKPNIWRDGIYQALDNMSLNYSELFNTVKKELKELNKSDRLDKLFNEQLIKLLKDGRIRISGYDESVHKNNEGKQVKRIQAFKIDGIIFELIRTDKTEPMDIISLLDLLEQIGDNDDKNKAQTKARLELLRLFEKKFKQYEKEEEVFWEKLKFNVISRTIDDEILELKRTLNEAVNDDELYKTNKDFHTEQINEMDRLKLYEDLKKDKKRANLHVIQMAKIETIQDNFKLCEISRGIDYLEPLVYEGDSWTPELFLKRKKLYKPKKKNLYEIRAIFRKLLFFVNTHENYNFMKNSFSWALSDEKDSMEWFELFIRNIPSQNSKLQNELGIEKRERRINKPKDIDQFASFLTDKLVEEFTKWEEN